MRSLEFNQICQKKNLKNIKPLTIEGDREFVYVIEKKKNIRPLTRKPTNVSVDKNARSQLTG